VENVDAVASILIPFRCVCVCGGGGGHIQSCSVCSLVNFVLLLLVRDCVWSPHPHTHLMILVWMPLHPHFPHARDPSSVILSDFTIF